MCVCVCVCWKVGVPHLAVRSPGDAGDAVAVAGAGLLSGLGQRRPANDPRVSPRDLAPVGGGEGSTRGPTGRGGRRSPETDGLVAGAGGQPEVVRRELQGDDRLGVTAEPGGAAGDSLDAEVGGRLVDDLAEGPGGRASEGGWRQRAGHWGGPAGRAIGAGRTLRLCSVERPSSATTRARLKVTSMLSTVNR